MKLQKQRTRKKEDYYKYVVVIPEDEIRKSELKEGDSLEAVSKKHEITLKKKD